jgi:hypothetical protein
MSAFTFDVPHENSVSHTSKAAGTPSSRRLDSDEQNAAASALVTNAFANAAGQTQQIHHRNPSQSISQRGPSQPVSPANAVRRPYGSAESPRAKEARRVAFVDEVSHKAAVAAEAHMAEQESLAVARAIAADSLAAVAAPVKPESSMNDPLDDQVAKRAAGLYQAYTDDQEAKHQEIIAATHHSAAVIAAAVEDETRRVQSAAAERAKQKADDEEAARNAPHFTRIRTGVLSPLFKPTSSSKHNARAAALVNSHKIIVPRPWEEKMKRDRKKEKQMQLKLMQQQQQQQQQLMLLQHSQSDSTLMSRSQPVGGTRSPTRGTSPPRPFDTSSPFTGTWRPGHLLQPLPAPPSFGHNANESISLVREEHGGNVGPNLSASNVALARSYHNSSPHKDDHATAAASSSTDTPTDGAAGMFESKELLPHSLGEKREKVHPIHSRYLSESKEQDHDVEQSMWDTIPTDRERVAKERQKVEARKARESVNPQDTLSAAAEAAASVAAGRSRQLHITPTGKHGRGRSPKRNGVSPQQRNYSPKHHIAAVHATTLDTIVAVARMNAERALEEERRVEEARAAQRVQKKQHRQLKKAQATHQRMLSASSSSPHTTRSSIHSMQSIQSTPSTKSHSTGDRNASPTPASPTSSQGGHQSSSSPPHSPNATVRAKSFARLKQRAAEVAAELESSEETKAADDKDSSSNPPVLTHTPSVTRGGSSLHPTEVGEHGRIRSRRGSIEPIKQADLIVAEDGSLTLPTGFNNQRRPSLRVNGAIALHVAPVDSAISGTTSPTGTADGGGESDLFHLDTPRGGRRLAAVSSPAELAAIRSSSNSTSPTNKNKHHSLPDLGEVPEDEQQPVRGQARAIAARKAGKMLRLSSADDSSPNRTLMLDRRAARFRRSNGTVSHIPDSLTNTVPLPPISNPEAGPNVQEYLQAMHHLAQKKKTEALLRTVVPLPKEFHQTGKGLLTEGFASVYTSTLTPALSALRRKKQELREKVLAQAELDRHRRDAESVARRDAWTIAEQKEKAATDARLAAENEYRLKQLAEERAERAERIQRDRSSIAARLAPNITFVQLFLTAATATIDAGGVPANALGTLESLFLERIHLQREFCEWFALLFKFALKHWGLETSQVELLFILLARVGPSDPMYTQGVSLLSQFQQFARTRVLESPALLRSQLLLRFHEKQRSGATTISEAMAARPHSPTRAEAIVKPTTLSTEESTKLSQLVFHAQKHTSDREARILATKASAEAAAREKREADARLRGEPAEEELAAEAAQKARAATRHARNASVAEAKHQRALTIHADLTAYKESPTNTGVTPAEAAAAAAAVPPSPSKGGSPNLKKQTSFAANIIAPPSPSKQSKDSTADKTASAVPPSKEEVKPPSESIVSQRKVVVMAKSDQPQLSKAEKAAAKAAAREAAAEAALQKVLDKELATIAAIAAKEKKAEDRANAKKGGAAATTKKSAVHTSPKPKSIAKAIAPAPVELARTNSSASAGAGASPTPSTLEHLGVHPSRSQTASPLTGVKSGRSARLPRTPGASALATALSVTTTVPLDMAVLSLADPTTVHTGIVCTPLSVPTPAPYQPIENDEPDLAALHSRVVQLLDAEDYKAALPLAEQELQQRESRYGGNTLDPRLLLCLDHIASMYEILEQPAAALPFLFQVLQIERIQAGSALKIASSVPVSDALLRLGEALVALREGEDAFNTFARCYLIRRNALGVNHPATVQAKQCVQFLTEAHFAVDELELTEIPLLDGEDSLSNGSPTHMHTAAASFADKHKTPKPNSMTIPPVQGTTSNIDRRKQ